MYSCVSIFQIQSQFCYCLSACREQTKKKFLLCTYAPSAFEILALCLLRAIVELLTYFTYRVNPTVTYFRMILCVPILGPCFL